MKNSIPNIGILDLQGDVIEHRRALEACGATVVSVKTVEDLKKVEALVIPGGESTTIGRLLKWTGLDEAICARARSRPGHGGMPIYGTCAGAILLANLGLMDIEVELKSVHVHTKSPEFLQKSSTADAGFNRVTFKVPAVLRCGRNHTHTFQPNEGLNFTQDFFFHAKSVF